MRRAGVVVWIALAACDRGAPPHREAPANATTPVARDAEVHDGTPPDHPHLSRPDAAVDVDAATVDAGPPPKDQATKCAAAAVRISKSLRSFSKEELAEDRAAITKVCIAGPWSAKALQCALHQADAYACTDDLPADQHRAFNAATGAVFCKHSDCIPDGVGPTSAPGSDVIDLDQ
jgi:hypothetical protein